MNNELPSLAVFVLFCTDIVVTFRSRSESGHGKVMVRSRSGYGRLVDLVAQC